MKALTIKYKYIVGMFILIAVSVVIGNMGYAGEITYPDPSYLQGDTLDHTDLNIKFGQIKGAVNDNNSKATLNDLSCTGGQVAKWNGLTSAWECGGAAGVEFTTSLENCLDDTPTDLHCELSDAGSTIQSVTLTAPGPGKVIVSFSAYYRMNHTIGSTDIIEVGISESCCVAVNGLQSRRYLSLPSAFPTGEFNGSVASHQVFDVLIGGDYTYYVLGESNKASASSSFRVSRPTTQAVFVPNRY